MFFRYSVYCSSPRVDSSISFRSERDLCSWFFEHHYPSRGSSFEIYVNGLLVFRLSRSYSGTFSTYEFPEYESIRSTLFGKCPSGFHCDSCVYHNCCYLNSIEGILRCARYFLLHLSSCV